MPADGFLQPAYHHLGREELATRAAQARASLADCRACPRDCRVNRLEDRWSACKTGRHAVVSSFFPHFGEEDCLRGWNGSGTIFFAHCNLRCVFCQNYDISQAVKPGTEHGSPAREIAAMMLSLQAQGCHNINFVTPDHVVLQVVESIEAAALGLHVPVVYNMDQYYPAGRVDATTYPEINRKLTSVEFREAQRIAKELGFQRLDVRRPHPRLKRRLVLV
jgi:putative pyruvate formate lyase activating enzyme